MAAIECDDLVVRYGERTAVDGVSLTARSGQVLAILGPNGAGKTTMLAMIGGDVRADSGTIVFNDRDVTNVRSSHRARLGLGRIHRRSRDLRLAPLRTRQIQ